MAAFTQLQTTLQSSFSTLSARERRLVVGGALIVLVFIVFFVTLSFSSTADKIRLRTSQKLSKLDEVLALTANYRQAKVAQEAAERQLAQSNIRLLSFVEENAKAKGLELPSVTPKAEIPIEGTKIVENSVELTLTDVKLNRLVEFLSAIENGPGVVKVKYLRLEPRPQNETITAWLTIATYHLKN